MSTYVVDIVLAVLVLLSVASWVLAVLKFRQNRKIVREAREFSALFWNCNGWDEARSVVDANQSDLANLARAGFTVYDEYRNSPHSLKHVGEINEVLERPLRQKAEEILREREAGLSELASIGSLSPFVGLFGTVWGIMGSLKSIGESGQASIDVVAGPIGEALIATAFGLIAALPAVYFYNYFNRRIRLNATDMEGFINDFMRLAVREIKKR